ncbi:MAG: 30S ribosome-binding factor RbfA [Bacilli bacterium]|nr:30S ribosome-binding factor RbfA [Bacilli bacterium]
MSVKIERLEHKFAIEISTIIKEEIKDDRISFVTVTDVDITNDLSFAKVYITVLDDSKKDETLKVLNHASKFIEKEMCKRVEVRKMPELKFVYDESIEYGNNIERIIERINEHE